MTDELAKARVRCKLDRLLADNPDMRLPTPGQLQEILGGPRLGRPPVDDPTEAVGVALPRSMIAKLDLKRGERSRSECIREAVRRWLRRSRESKVE